MADIVIRMDMPKSCDVCPFVGTNDDLMSDDYRYLYCGFPYMGQYVTDYEASRHPDCPLGFVPAESTKEKWDRLIGLLDRANKMVESAKPKWISVDERMPAPDTEVLVFAVGLPEWGFDGKTTMAIAYRFNYRFWSSGKEYEGWSTPWEYFHKDYKITHWMPLPEPPEEGGVEDG